MLSWIYELNLEPVDFELDTKLVIDDFHLNNYDVAEFREIILSSYIVEDIQFFLY
jgi:hypothetical protein